MTSADVGKHLRVGVRALNLVQPLLSAEKLSASVGPVAAPAGFEPTPPSSFPQLANGTSAPWGQTMSIDTGGNWKSNGTTTATTFAYRWYRCELNLSGCVPLPTTASSYTTTTDDVEHVVKATVIGTIAGTSSPERLANFSGAVYEQTPQALALPRVVGPAHVGTKLQSTAGAWTGNDPTFTRRWLRCNASGVQCAVTSPVVTTPTYTVRAVDRGFTFRVEVTATVVDQFQARTGEAESARSAVVVDPPPTCAQLKTAVAKAQQAVTAAQKALKMAKKTGDRAKIKKAQKKLTTAKAALKKAKAKYASAGC